MPYRNIIIIDEEKCDGCGDCVDACIEGAIRIIDAKAKLVSEILCDGFGACLGSCPQDALKIEKRDVAEFDHEAAEQNMQKAKQQKKPESSPQPQTLHQGCPGSALRSFGDDKKEPQTTGISAQSRLSQWPIQLMLVPPHAPFLKNSDMVICADCVPFAVPDFHNRYLKDRKVLVGCPKLDDLQHYFEKFKEIFRTAQPEKITVLKMEVPCCSGIAQAAIMALQQENLDIPIEVHTIGIEGDIRIEKIESEKSRTKSA